MLVCLNTSPDDDLVECDAYLLKNFRQDLLTSETLIAEYFETPERRYSLPKDDAEALKLYMDMKEQDVAQC